MVGSRCVQSARKRATFLAFISANTSAFASVVFLLYWQVMHHAAVKSTNTGRLAANSALTFSCVHACHVADGEDADAALEPSFDCAIKGPIVPANSAKLAMDTAEKIARLRPVKFNDHTTHASTSSSASNAAAPSTPLKCPSTHTSQITVASMGKARKRRSVSIHAPGRGSRRSMPGTHATSKNGNARPIPSAAKIPNACAAGSAIA